MKKDSVPEESQDEIFKLVSRVKYPHDTDPRQRRHGTVPAQENAVTELQPNKVELIIDRRDINESLKAIAEKYNLREITLATDDGLVFATSADHDVQMDAVKFSQVVRHQAPPDEPDVTLFELMHRESKLIGIVRTGQELPQNWKRQIRDDTKVILQWWL